MHRTGMKLERAKKDGKLFLNPVLTEVGGVAMIPKFIWTKLTNKLETVPKVPPGPFWTDAAVYGRMPESGLRVTWFGHSAMLAEVDGVRLLVDPVWDERAAPVEWAGPKRFFAPTLPLSEMPKLDAVLISHDHYDHLGKKTVEELARRMPGVRWITSLGVGSILETFGVQRERVTELDWTEETLVEGGEGTKLRVISVPMRHFSGRSAWNRFETLWAGFVLQGSEHKVLYGADSGMWEGFAEIGRVYGPFDLAMLEIGAFHESWRAIHLGPDGAVEAFEALGAKVLMPIHWGLFDLGLHAWRQPMERMSELAADEEALLVPAGTGKADGGRRGPVGLVDEDVTELLRV